MQWNYVGLARVNTGVSHNVDPIIASCQSSHLVQLCDSAQSCSHSQNVALRDSSYSDSDNINENHSADLFGELVDHAFRIIIEFQTQGSPHDHCVLWAS